MISNEEKLLKERIRHLLTTKKAKISDFAKTESERVMLGRQINGKDTIVPYKTIYMLLYAYHDIDANWLILGEGTMTRIGNLAAPHIHNNFKNEVNGSKAGGDINVGVESVPAALQALLDEKDARIEELQRDKQTLRTVIDALTVKPRTI